jgi:hypothetical protein
MLPADFLLLDPMSLLAYCPTSPREVEFRMSESSEHKLIIVIAKLGSRKCFKYLGNGKSNILLAAGELLLPQQTNAVTAVIKQGRKPETRLSMWHSFALFKADEKTYYKKVDTLKASMFEVGTRIEFTAHSTSVPGTAYDPLPDFALRYWGVLTSNPKAPADTAFKVTHLANC